MNGNYFESAEVSDVGKKRKNNEDACLQIPGQGIYCVADGMGGQASGDYASQTIIATLRAMFDSPLPGEGASLARRVTRLRRTVNEASKKIYHYAEEKGAGPTGSTVVALVIDPGNPRRAAALHAGDSRLYRYRAGKLKQLTADHSVVDSLLRQGIPLEKIPLQYQNEIQRAVGLRRAVELEKTPVEVASGDLFLMCSDGLSKMLPDDQVAQILGATAGEPVQRSAQALIDAANEAGGKDNVTVILIRALDLSRAPAKPDPYEGDDEDVTLIPAASAEMETPIPETPAPETPVNPAAKGDPEEGHTRHGHTPHTPPITPSGATRTPTTMQLIAKEEKRSGRGRPGVGSSDEGLSMTFAPEPPPPSRSARESTPSPAPPEPEPVPSDSPDTAMTTRTERDYPPAKPPTPPPVEAATPTPITPATQQIPLPKPLPEPATATEIRPQETGASRQYLLIGAVLASLLVVAGAVWLLTTKRTSSPVTPAAPSVAVATAPKVPAPVPIPVPTQPAPPPVDQAAVDQQKRQDATAAAAENQNRQRLAAVEQDLQQGRQAITQLDYVAAAEWAGKALAIIPDDPSAQKLQADVAQAQAQALSEQYADALQAGRTALESGDTNAASRALDQMQSLKPGDAAAGQLRASLTALNQAQTDYEQSDYAGAEQICRQYATVAAFEKLQYACQTEAETLANLSKRFAQGDYTYTNELKSTPAEHKPPFAALIREGSQEARWIADMQGWESAGNWRQMANQLQSMSQTNATLAAKAPVRKLAKWVNDAEKKYSSDLYMNNVHFEQLLVWFDIKSNNNPYIQTAEAKKAEKQNLQDFNPDDIAKYISLVDNLNRFYAQNDLLDPERKKLIAKLKEKLGNAN